MHVLVNGACMSTRAREYVNGMCFVVGPLPARVRLPLLALSLFPLLLGLESVKPGDVAMEKVCAYW